MNCYFTFQGWENKKSPSTLGRADFSPRYHPHSQHCWALTVHHHELCQDNGNNSGSLTIHLDLFSSRLGKDFRLLVLPWLTPSQGRFQPAIAYSFPSLPFGRELCHKDGFGSNNLHKNKLLITNSPLSALHRSPDRGWYVVRRPRVNGVNTYPAGVPPW